MARYTLLDLVQKTLTYIDDFNVTSVSDTEEAEQVVVLANQVYTDLISTYPWPHLKTETTLAASSNTVTCLTHQLRIPSEEGDSVRVLGIDWIKYNKKDVRWLDPKDMRDKLDKRDTTLSTVDTYGALNDTDPTYWTSFDDQVITFDSYDSSLDYTLSKVGCIRAPSELTNDEDEPDLPERFHPVLLHGIIAEAARILKGDVTQGAIYDKKFKDGVNKMKRWARRINGVETTMPLDFGRKNVANAIKTLQTIEA